MINVALPQVAGTAKLLTCKTERCEEIT